MTAIHLPEEALQEVVRGAILKMLDNEAREKIIAQAIAYMSTPETTSYGASRGQTPLGQAFTIAVRASMQQLVHEMVQSDPEVRAFVETTLKRMVRDFTKQIDMDGDIEIRSAMLDAAVGVLAKRESRQ